jgi:hypothetical protein
MQELLKRRFSVAAMAQAVDAAYKASL